MRRFVLMVLAVASVVVAVSSIGSSAATVPCKDGLTPTCPSPSPSPPSTCKNGLTPTCPRKHAKKPVIRVRALGVACHRPTTSFRLPPITITSSAGLSRIRITVDGRTIRNLSFRAPRPHRKVVRGVTVSTAGLRAGLQTVTITATDRNHRTSRRQLHFTVCPSPVFTG